MKRLIQPYGSQKIHAVEIADETPLSKVNEVKTLCGRKINGFHAVGWTPGPGELCNWCNRNLNQADVAGSVQKLADENRQERERHVAEMDAAKKSRAARDEIAVAISKKFGSFISDLCETDEISVVFGYRTVTGKISVDGRNFEIEVIIK